MGANVKRVKMAATPESNPTIARLTPLAEVLAALDRDVAPVPPREVAAADCLGRVLAADIYVPAAIPETAIALIDGWAVRAEATLDAGSYAPVILPQAPPRIDAGEAMPAGADAVAAVDAIVMRAGRAEAVATVVAGDGVVPAGASGGPDIPLRRAGERVRLADLAVLAASGIVNLNIRAPRVVIIPARSHGMIDAGAQFVAGDIAQHGGNSQIEKSDDVLGEKSADAIVIIGGTGNGRDDASVQKLADAGRVAFHGIALTPGETAALGFAINKPVLLLPGRLDAAIAVWLTIGRHMLARLAGCGEQETASPATLTRKVSSTVSLVEFVPVRRDGGKAEPLAAKYLPLSVLTQADGWILVPAESEGYAPGASVAVRAWP